MSLRILLLLGSATLGYDSAEWWVAPAVQRGLINPGKRQISLPGGGSTLTHYQFLQPQRTSPPPEYPSSAHNPAGCSGTPVHTVSSKSDCRAGTAIRGRGESESAFRIPA